MRIAVLSDLVSSQIAAGEVVERPASVVKELIENSLDAQASKIIVRVNDAGKSLISVEDDGVGIPEEELILAVARHATSKLRKIEDLEHIETLGFRGEALASIGSVSNLRILSRVKSSQTGTCMTCSAGVCEKVEKIPLTIGTTVVVENLFFNIPARLKFLKQDQTEMNLITDIVQRYAVEYSHVQFKYNVNQKDLMITSGNGDMNDGLIHLFGYEAHKQMLSIQSKEDPFFLRGIISPISLTKSTRKGITFFVNGRWIQDNGLVSTFLQAYRSFLMIGRFPFCYLSINLPSEEVDVNVHPSKAQIKIKNSDRLMSFIHREVKKRISELSPVPKVNFLGWQAKSQEINNDAFQFVRNQNQEDNAGVSVKRSDNLIQGSLMHFPLLRPIGQIGLVYIAAEGPDGLYLIDQHAAHERILFEKIIKKDVSYFTSQQTLEKVIIDLPLDKAELLKGNIEYLNAFGFLIESFGERAFIIRAVPKNYQDINPKDLILSILDEPENEKNYLELTREHFMIANICKKLAIKGGQALTIEEQRKLLEELENCESPRTCPHGRTTMIYLSVDMLERQFGRKGSI